MKMNLFYNRDDKIKARMRQFEATLKARLRQDLAILGIIKPILKQG